MSDREEFEQLIAKIFRDQMNNLLEAMAVEIEMAPEYTMLSPKQVAEIIRTAKPKWN